MNMSVLHRICIPGLILCMIFGLIPGISYAQSTTRQFSLDTGDELYDVAWSPNGQVLAVAGSWGVKLFDQNLTEITQVGANIPIVSVAWKPDSSQLATAGGLGSGFIAVWNIDLANNQFTQAAYLISSHEREFVVSWNPTTLELASIAADEPQYFYELVGTIEVWNSNSWTLARTVNLNILSPTRSLSWFSETEVVVGNGDCSVELTICLSGSSAGIYIVDTVSGAFRQVVSTYDKPSVFAVAPNGAVAVQDFLTLSIYMGASSQRVSFYELSLLIERMAWNPDGTKLAIGFSGASGAILLPFTGQLFRYDLSYQVSGEMTGIDWHPVEQKVATVTRQGFIEIWDTSLIAPDPALSTVTPLPTFPSIPTQTATVTPTATQLPLNKFAISSQASNGFSQIFTTSFDGSNLSELLLPLEAANDPSWSPEGSRIAFAGILNTNSLSQIWTANADGTNVQAISQESASSYDPAWSPDGQWIVFTSERDGNKEIYATRADGSTINSPTRLTNHPADDYNPDWSAQNTITFVSTRSNSGVPDIFTMSILGGNIQNLTNTPTIAENQPVWSPSARQIAFIASENGNSALNVINAVGTGRSQ
jgi:WD40 repeat protein